MFYSDRRNAMSRVLCQCITIKNSTTYYEESKKSKLALMTAGLCIKNGEGIVQWFVGPFHLFSEISATAVKILSLLSQPSTADLFSIVGK